MIRQALAILMLVLALGQGGIHSLVDQTSLGGNLYLVNRSYRLSQGYMPDDLVRPQVRGAGADMLLRQEAAKALEELFAAAKTQRYQLIAVSGYRSYQTQRLIFNRKINTTGSREKAELWVAPPGTSEHQLGLAMDISRSPSGQLSANFGHSKEGQWVASNAHLYGFIIRYKAAWTPVTGYGDEPWHLRYVGKEHANAIYQLDIPLEHYVEQLAQLHFGNE